MEFDTQDALDAYLKEHPGADKSKHKVKKDDDGGGAKDKDEGKSKEDRAAEKKWSESFGKYVGGIKGKLTSVAKEALNGIRDEAPAIVVGALVGGGIALALHGYSLPSELQVIPAHLSSGPNFQNRHMIAEHIRMIPSTIAMVEMMAGIASAAAGVYLDLQRSRVASKDESIDADTVKELAGILVAFLKGEKPRKPKKARFAVAGASDDAKKYTDMFIKSMDMNDAKWDVVTKIMTEDGKLDAYKFLNEMGKMYPVVRPVMDEARKLLSKS